MKALMCPRCGSTQLVAKLPLVGEPKVLGCAKCGAKFDHGTALAVAFAKSMPQGFANNVGKGGKENV